MPRRDAAALRPAPARRHAGRQQRRGPVLRAPGRDSADLHLADEFTEEIILRLQQLPRLEVKSRYESQRVRGQRGAAPAALGRTLGVRWLVNGSVQRAGDRVVVRVEMTRADRGVGVWSERFDQASGSVLDVIDAVARGVATGVAGRLLPDEAATIARRPSSDAVAYEEFRCGNNRFGERGGPASARRRSRVADPRLMRAYEARGGARLALGDRRGAREDADRAVRVASGALAFEAVGFQAVILAQTDDRAPSRLVDSIQTDAGAASCGGSGRPVARAASWGRTRSPSTREHPWAASSAASWWATSS